MEPTDRPELATRSRRLLGGIFLLTLSGITGVISYEHGLDVARWVGNTGLVAYLVPLVPDLMIVTSSLTLLEASALRAPRPVMAMVALVAGIGWTVAQNVAAGARNSPGGALVAVAFVVTFESLLWLFRRGRGGAVVLPAPATSSQPEPPEPMTTDEALQALLESASQRALSELLGVPRTRIQAWTGRLAPVAEDTPAGVAPSPPGAQPPAPGGAPAGATNGQHAEGR